MATSREGEETEPAQAVRRHRRTRAQIEEPPVPEPEPMPEPEPEPVPAPAVVHTSSHTCSLCNGANEVDLDNLAGGRFITEPSLSIRHYICPECNGA